MRVPTKVSKTNDPERSGRISTRELKEEAWRMIGRFKPTGEGAGLQFPA